MRAYDEQHEWESPTEALEQLRNLTLIIQSQVHSLLKPSDSPFSLVSNALTSLLVVRDILMSQFERLCQLL